MIIGIGHDLLEIARIDSILSGATAVRFMAKVLTPAERQLAKDYEGQRLSQFVSGRFAAKEAVVKAFGCGIGQLLGFQDIEVLRSGLGKPLCLLSAEGWKRLGLDAQCHSIHVTITHERSMASAFVVVEKR